MNWVMHNLKIIPLWALLLVIGNCTLFQPRVTPVKPVYLGNETELEKKKMEQLENTAISIRDEMKQTEKEQDINRQKKIVNSKKQESMKATLAWLTEWNRLLVLQGNDQKAADVVSTMNTKNTEIGGEVIYGQLIDAEVNSLEKKLKMKQAELAKALAELEQIKAEIGVRNQLKMQIGPENANAIKIDEYRHYYNIMNEEYAKTKSQYDLTVAEKNKIRKQLESSGYKPEY